MASVLQLSSSAALDKLIRHPSFRRVELDVKGDPHGGRALDLPLRFLSRYERAWRGRIGAEIPAGRLFRRIFERMTAGEIDAVFRVLAADGLLDEVAAAARFDWHRGVILAMLRHPRLDLARRLAVMAEAGRLSPSGGPGSSRSVL
jgi:hypothetical protein